MPVRTETNNNQYMNKHFGKWIIAASLFLVVGAVSPSFAQICDEDEYNATDTVAVKSPVKPRYNTKKRITFLWDVTLSMYGKSMAGGYLHDADVSPNIYDKVQESIIAQIDKVKNETVEIVVIPFQEGVLVSESELPEWTCVAATPENKARLIQKIRDSKEYFYEYAQSHGAGTDILSSLKWVTAKIFDENRTDILYLLTDGGQGGRNVPGKKEDLENYINGDWTGYALERNVQGFYLMLTKEAKNEMPNIDPNSPLKPKDISEVDDYPSPVNIQLKSSLSLDMKDKETYKQEYFVLTYGIDGGDLPAGAKLKVRICNNGYIALNQEYVAFGENDIRIPFRFLKNWETAKNELPEESRAIITVEFVCDSPEEQAMAMVTPVKIPVTLINKPQPTIKIRWEY